MYWLTRFMFFASMGTLVAVLAIAFVGVFIELPAIMSNLPWALLLAVSIVEFLAATVLCRMVICRKCGKHAMLIADSNEPGHIHNPWRKRCIHCAHPLP